MFPLISRFTLMPLNFINVRPVFGLFVENEHEIQFKTAGLLELLLQIVQSGDFSELLL